MTINSQEIPKDQIIIWIENEIYTLQSKISWFESILRHLDNLSIDLGAKHCFKQSKEFCDEGIANDNEKPCDIHRT